MPSTFSPSLRIELIAPGEQAGTWGTTTNTNLGTLLESAVAGLQTVSVISGNQALTIADGAADQSRSAVLRFTTTTGAPFNVYAPPVSKQYTIVNASAFAMTIFASTVAGNTTAAGTGVTVPAGRTMTVRTDGVDFVQQNTHFISPTIADPTITGTASLVNISYSGTLTGGTGVVNLGSGQVYKDASGNVGIGTSSPSGRLQIAGANASQTFRVDESTSSYNYTQGLDNVGVYFSSNSASRGFRWIRDAQIQLEILTNANIGVRPSSVIGAGNGWAGAAEASSATLELYNGSTGNTTLLNNGPFSVVFGTNAAERMRINASGNVGIGTQTPSSVLVVKTGTNQNVEVRPASSLVAGAAGVGFDALNDARNAVVDMAVRGTNLSLVGSGSTPMRFYTNEAERVRIDSSGNVGIGTLSPSQKLDVVGNGFFTGILRMTGDGTAAAPSIQPGNDGDTGFFRPSSNNIGFTTGGTERMRINSAGNVGIGLDPGRRLDISDPVNRSLTNNADSQVRITGSGYSGFFALNLTSFQIGQNSNERSMTFHTGGGMPARLSIGPDGFMNRVVPGGTTLLPDFACRAWVFHATNGDIFNSGNISSVTLLSTGQYRANLSTAMPDATYALAGAPGSDGRGLITFGKTTTSFDYGSFSLGVAYGNNIMNITVFR